MRLLLVLLPLAAVAAVCALAAPRKQPPDAWGDGDVWLGADDFDAARERMNFIRAGGKSGRR